MPNLSPSLKLNMNIFSSFRREKKPVLTPRGSDSLSQLSELLHAGEERGIFAGTERMPLKILQNIREENLEFMKSKDVFSQEYYRFIHQLVSANVVSFFFPFRAFIPAHREGRQTGHKTQMW